MELNTLLQKARCYNLAFLNCGNPREQPHPPLLKLSEYSEYYFVRKKLEKGVDVYPEIVYNTIKEREKEKQQ